MSSLLINGSAPTALQLAAIRSDLGLGSGTPGAANGVALLDNNTDLPVAQLPPGMSPLGPYTTVALLEAAFPASSNAGKTAYIGASAPYTEYVSNGVTGVSGWKAIVTYTQDNFGNINGINSSLNSQVSLAASVSGITQTIILGDSMTAAASNNVTISSVTRNNNIVTAVASGSNINTGEVVRIYNMLDISFNTNNSYVTRVDTNTFTYPSIGANGTTTNISTTALMQAQFKAVQQNNSYYFWLNAKTGGAFKAIINAGNNGQNSSQMLARINTDVLPYNPQAVIIFTGYNDFPNSNLSATQVYNNITSIIAQLAGRLVIVVSTIPWITGGTTANRVEAVKYNRMIRAYCNITPNCRYADAAKYLVDNNNAVRFSPLTGMLRNDGIHPSPKGAERIAQSIIDVVKNNISIPSRLVSSIADTYGYDSSNPNIMDSAPFTNTGGYPVGGTSGVVAGGIAVSLSGTGTAVASAPARTDGVGYDQQVVFTPAAANDSITISNPGYITGRFNVGDTVQFLAEVSFSGLAGANIKGMSGSMGLNGVFGSPTFMVDMAENLASQMNIDGTYTLVSPETILGTGTIGITWNFILTANSSGSAVTVKIGKISIEKL